MTDAPRPPADIPVEENEAATEESEWRPPAPSDPARLDAIEAHMTKHFGETSSVLHEIMSDLVHLDVHVIRPAAGRDRFTLFTTGMSDLPMAVPPGEDDHRLAELLLDLPASWPIDSEDDRWYWPIDLLTRAARFPHLYETWLGHGHTITHEDPPEPWDASTRLCAALLLSPIDVPEEARTVRLPDGGTVQLLRLHAIHADEMQLELDRGLDALLDAFETCKVGEVLDPGRRSAVKRKRFGLF
jgi:suppressor of fused protein SUFU